MSAPEASAGVGGPPRVLRLAIAGAAGLVAIGAVAFYYAVQFTHSPVAADVFRVTITARACEPNALSVPAGRRAFEIANASDRPVEWEILDGVMVVAERENIAPGFKARIVADLAPGQLSMTCGLLSNPHGTLTVTPSEAAAVAASAPTMRAFLGPLAEYQFYLGMQAATLADATQALADAVKSGDLDQARAAYAAARAPYKGLETVAYRFSDLVNRMNPQADYLAGREADPAFTGFHRIAWGLYTKDSLDDLQAVADRLAADGADLKARLRGMKLAPADLVGGAARLADQLASGRIASGEDAYSRADLSDVAANLASIAKVADLVAPVARSFAPDAVAQVQSALAAVSTALDRLKEGDGFKPFDAVDAATRASLAQAFGALAQALRKLEPAVAVRN